MSPKAPVDQSPEKKITPRKTRQKKALNEVLVADFRRFLVIRGLL